MNQKLNNLIYRLSTRFPSLNMPINHFIELFKQVTFTLDFPRRRKLWRKFEKLNDKNDYYDFAVNVYPSCQIKSEIVQFLEFAEEYRPKVICEIGTFEGGTNFLLGQSISSVDTIIGVDLFCANVSLLSTFSKVGKKHHYIRGSSYSKETVQKVKNALGNKTIDLLFIDGDHSYEGVKKDYEMYLPLISKKALVVFHDIVEDHFTRFKTQTINCAGGVPKFWNEIKLQFLFKEFIANPEQDGFGIGVLVIDKNKQFKSL
jgi:predicted O-methyltransferase YrrM